MTKIQIDAIRIGAPYVWDSPNVTIDPSEENADSYRLAGLPQGSNGGIHRTAPDRWSFSFSSDAVDQTSQDLFQTKEAALAALKYWLSLTLAMNHPASASRRPSPSV